MLEPTATGTLNVGPNRNPADARRRREGEPNDANGEDFMAQTGGGGWNDVSLLHECEFVCQGEVVCEPLPNLGLKYGALCARAVLGCIIATACLKGFITGRNYIARHSEAQIDAHFQGFSKVSACSIDWPSATSKV